MKIIEVCNPRYANDSLSKDIRPGGYASVPDLRVQRGGKTVVNAFRPTVMCSFFLEDGIKSQSAQIEKATIDIANSAK
jgi:uncharacterized protein (DUF302 family)